MRDDGKSKVIIALASKVPPPGRKPEGRESSRPRERDDDDLPVGLASALSDLFSAKTPEERAKAFREAHRICSSYEE